MPATVKDVIQATVTDPLKVYTSSRLSEIVEKKCRTRFIGPVLSQLVEDGTIQRIRHGHYVLPARRRA